MRRRVRKTVVAGAILGVTLVAVALPLALPLPVPLARRAVLASTGWLVGESGSSGRGPAERGWRRLQSSYLQHSLIRGYQRTQEIPPGLTEVDHLVARLLPLQDLLLTQLDVPHAPGAWHAFISGVGFCDQVNGVAAELLAAEFPRSQTFALVDPGRGSPHTVGRVWSERHADWLYFDVFWGGVVVFRYAPGGEITFLARADVPERRGANLLDEASLRRLYALVEHGWVLNEYHSTFGEYLLFKVRQAGSSRSIDAASGQVGGAPASGALSSVTPRAEAGREEMPARAPAADARLHRAYLAARLEHVFGATADARSGYARVRAAASSRSTSRDDVLVSAAAVFEQRLRAASSP